MDFQLPKLYFWPGMQPGFRYTVVQYVDTLISWNPGLSRETATRVVERLMGITVPDDYPVQEFDRPAPASFYEGIATDEIRKIDGRLWVTPSRRCHGWAWSISWGRS